MKRKTNNSITINIGPPRVETDYNIALKRTKPLTEADEKNKEEFEARAEDYEERQYNLEDQDDFELMSRFPETAPLSLANFKLSNGNEVRILGVPEVDEVMIGEFSDAGVEDFLIDPEMQPAEIFRRLAPEDSPVPRMLSPTAGSTVFEGRKLVDTLDKTVDVSLEELGIESVPASAAAGAGSCQSGSAGAQFFKDHHCNTGGGPGYGASESYCYSGAYQWIQKTSSKRRRATYARMASCGSGMNRMRHFYRTVSGYKTQVNVYVDPHKVVHWWSAKKGIRRYRRVRFEAHEPGGWVRGWVVYHSQIAGGWF